MSSKLSPKVGQYVVYIEMIQGNTTLAVFLISIAYKTIANRRLRRVGKIALVQLFSAIANSDSGSGYQFPEK